MNQFDRPIYELLLSDNRFLDWASGKTASGQDYWKQWQKDNPEFQSEFDEALRVARMLKFKTSQVNQHEIEKRWSRTKKTMKKDSFFSVALMTKGYRLAAAVLIVPILIASGWFFYNYQQLKSEYGRMTAYNYGKVIRVQAPLGGQLELSLPDGSKAWLNAGSEINYPAWFAEAGREVEMTGEVYFKVAKSDKPFLVKNPGPTIRVYGTEFNVKAYGDEEQVIVALAEGKIALEQKTREIFMAPGDVLVFEKATNRLSKLESDLYQQVCWREGKYIFRDTPLKQILKTLQRRYNVSIYLDDPELNDFKYNATFSGESLEQILELMTYSAPIEFEYTKQQLTPDGSYSQAKVRLWRDKNKIFNLKK